MKYLLYFVVQRLDFFLPFSLTDFIGVRDLEKLRGHFYEPFGLNGGDSMTIFAGREDQLVVNQPRRRTVKECTGRMNVHKRPFYKCLIALLRILLSSIPKKT